MSSESSPQVGEGWDRSLPESQMTRQLSSQTLPEFSLSPQLIIVAYLLDNATGLVCVALGLKMTLYIYIAPLFSKNI